MKKCFLFAFTAFCFVTSCKKETVDPNNALLDNINAKVLATTPMNAECTRIQAALNNCYGEVWMKSETNYGRQDTEDSTQDYKLMAAQRAADLKLWMDGNLYEKNTRWNQWSYAGNGLEKYYGKTVHVKISNGVDSAVRDLYIPKPLRSPGVYKDSTFNLTFRTGNVFRWKPDPNNPTGKIAIYYELYQGGNRLTWEYLVVDDNGSFNMDPFIPKEASSYNLTLYRGNAIAFQHGNKKFRFLFMSSDIHEYTLLD